MIDLVFEKAEAEIIKSIPLSSTSQPNATVWPFTPLGRYSIQSGYRFLQDSSVATQRSAYDLEFWRNLWGMEVLSKIKNFVWRASKESLPTKRNLLCRKITNSALCENCRVMRIVHMLFSIVLTCRWFGARIHNGAGFRLCRDVVLKKFSRKLL